MHRRTQEDAVRQDRKKPLCQEKVRRQTTQPDVDIIPAIYIFPSDLGGRQRLIKEKIAVIQAEFFLMS